MAFMSARQFIDPRAATQWIQASDREFYATNPSKAARLMYELGKRRLNPHSTEALLEYGSPHYVMAFRR